MDSNSIRTVKSVSRLVVIAAVAAVLLSACGGAATATQQGNAQTTQETAATHGYPPPAETATQATAGYPAPQATTPMLEPSVTSQPASAPSVTSFPDPAQFEWRLKAEGIDRPTDLADPGNGALWVLSQGGILFQVRDGQVSQVMDIRSLVGSSGNEQGLLGIALDPNFDANRFFYVNYTDTNGNTVIARFTATSDLASADPQSQEILLQVDQPYANHNGGSMAFGPDGLLYMGLGDGGSGGDPQNNAQSTDTLLGKILRIDVSQGEGYAIPVGNPYASGGGRPEIYAIGLRNPWRFSFDRTTGDLYIADVGQNVYEEVDYKAAGSTPGANFGWRYREGLHPYTGTPPSDLKLVDPIWEYDHSEGCSITGGFVYRGEVLPEFSGIYLVGDFCSGTIWGLLHGTDGSWTSQKLWTEQGNLTSFGENRNGELYYLNQYNGGLYQLVRK